MKTGGGIAWDEWFKAAYLCALHCSSNLMSSSDEEGGDFWGTAHMFLAATIRFATHCSCLLDAAILLIVFSASSSKIEGDLGANEVMPFRRPYPRLRRRRCTARLKLRIKVRRREGESAASGARASNRARSRGRK